MTSHHANILNLIYILSNTLMKKKFAMAEWLSFKFLAMCFSVNEK
jgi:hypothetical protein